MKKRLLSIVLTLAMMMTIMPVIVNAQEKEAEKEGIYPAAEYAEQLSVQNDADAEADNMSVFNTSKNVQVAGGYNHSVVLKEDGTVWAWGGNEFGLLGDGTTTDRMTPAKIEGLTDIIKVSAGYNFMAALKADGTVYAWGNNYNGQLGDGTTTDHFIPAKVIGLSGVKDIAAGFAHIVALKQDGTVYAWGNNMNGQLEEGTSDSSVPLKVNELADIKGITAGEGYAVALKENGTVYAWGYNGQGQLGDGTTTNRSTPVQVQGLTDVKAISSGNSHTLALKNNGTVYAWGYNGDGQLGDGTRTSRSTSVQVSTMNNVKAIATGFYHSVVQKEDGTVHAWGNNDYGQLGDGTTIRRNIPVQTIALTGVKTISAGVRHTLAITQDGIIYAWGDNLKGQLGDNPILQCSTPTQVNTLSDVQGIVAGNEYMVAVTQNGSVYTWGKEASGTLGEDVIYHNTPIAVSRLKEITAIAGGYFHMLALKQDGTVYAWGSNSSGQLGNELVQLSYAALRVDGLTGIKAIAAGGYHTVALKEDGTIYTLGSNRYGQLGDGTTTNHSSPVQVTGLADVKAIAAGKDYTVALKEDGTMYAWGNNDNGQLGDGTTTDRSSPVQVTNLTDIKAIAAGDSYTIALKNDGTVYTWGYNNSYQLGDGTIIDRSIPSQVNGLTNIKSIGAGYSHTLAVKEDGTVYGWGDNRFYQLGEDTPDYCTTPTLINGLTDVKSVAVSTAYTAALKEDGTIYTLGDDTYGQLGHGRMLYSAVPYKVENINNKHITQIDNLKITADQGLPLGIGEKPHAVGGVATTVDVPQTVTIHLDNDTTRELPVIWDDMAYKPYQTGKQTITGTVETAGTDIDNPSGLSATLEITVVPAQYEVFSISPETISATVLSGTPIGQICGKLSPKTIDIEAINTETGEIVYLYSDYTLSNDYPENAGYNPEQLGTQSLIGRFDSCIVDTFMPPYVEIQVDVIASEISNVPTVEMNAYQSMEFADNANIPQQVTVETMSGATAQVDVEWNTGNYQKDLAGDQIITGKLVNLPSGALQTDPEKVAALIVHVQPVNYKITSVLSDILDTEIDAGYALDEVQSQLPVHTAKVQLQSTNLENTVTIEYDMPFILDAENNTDYNPDASDLYVLNATFALPDNIVNPDQYIYEIFLFTNPVGIQSIEPVYVTTEMGTAFADIEKPAQVCVTLENGRQEWIDADWGTGEGYVADADELTEDNPIQSTVKGTLCNRPEYINYADEQAELVITVILPRAYSINSITPVRIPETGVIKVNLGSSPEEIYSALETHSVTVELKNLKNVISTQEVTFTLRTEDNPDYDPMSEQEFELTAYLNLPEGVENPDNQQLTVAVIPTKYTIKSAVVVKIGGVIVGTPFEEIGLPENAPVTYTDGSTGALPATWNDATYSLTKIGAQAIKGAFNMPLPIYVENPNNRQPAAALTVVNPSVRIISAVPVENAKLFALDGNDTIEHLPGLSMRDYKVELLHEDGSVTTEIISVFEETDEN